MRGLSTSLQNALVLVSRPKNAREAFHPTKRTPCMVEIALPTFILCSNLPGQFEESHVALRRHLLEPKPLSSTDDDFRDLSSHPPWGCRCLHPSKIAPVQNCTRPKQNCTRQAELHPSSRIAHVHQACQRGLHEPNQGSTVGDGVRIQRTKPAPPVVPCSPTRWQMLDNIDVNAVYQTRLDVLQNCPAHLKGRFRQASRTALDARNQAALGGDATQEIRAWKLFCVLPFWLLRRLHCGGRLGKAELSKRLDDFSEGLWM